MSKRKRSPCIQRFIAVMERLEVKSGPSLVMRAAHAEGLVLTEVIANSIYKEIEEASGPGAQKIKLPGWLNRFVQAEFVRLRQTASRQRKGRTRKRRPPRGVRVPDLDREHISDSMLHLFERAAY